MIYRIFKPWRNRNADFTHDWFMSLEGLLLVCLVLLVSPSLLKIGLSITLGKDLLLGVWGGLISKEQIECFNGCAFRECFFNCMLCNVLPTG